MLKQTHQERQTMQKLTLPPSESIDFNGGQNPQLYSTKMSYRDPMGYTQLKHQLLLLKGVKGIQTARETPGEGASNQAKSTPEFTKVITDMLNTKEAYLKLLKEFEQDYEPYKEYQKMKEVLFSLQPPEYGIHFHKTMSDLLQKPNIRFKITFKMLDNSSDLEHLFCDHILSFKSTASDPLWIIKFTKCLMLYEMYIKMQFEAQHCQFHPKLDREYKGLELKTTDNYFIQTQCTIKNMLQLNMSITFFTPEETSPSNNLDNQIISTEQLSDLINNMSNSIIEPSMLNHLNYEISKLLINHIICNHIFKDSVLKV